MFFKENFVNRPHARGPLPDPTIQMTEGWHCLHLYYTVDEQRLNAISAGSREDGRSELADILNPERDGAPLRVQTSVAAGHRADLGLMIMDKDPLKIDGIQQAVRASRLGSALIPSYSFVSITEISEYVPTVEQYSERLLREGATRDDPAFAAKVGAYEKRLPAMNQQRLYPDLPELPVHCFYPMNKIRDPHANWYTEPWSSRSSMMSEHATSGIAFAGRVSQLITASTGFDDWEWGVTLWARAPEHIKDIVYTMRFDTASAKYAEFGPFYISYVMSPDDAIAHLKL